MEMEKKREFTLRISGANRTELVVIMYEIIREDIIESKIAIENKDREKLIDNIKQARGILNHLMASLDYHYPLSFILIKLYIYLDKLLSNILGNRDVEKLDEAQSAIEKLRDDFLEIAKQDNSAPVMKNTESIYAGLTYGKQSLNESVDMGNKKRGITV